MSLNAYAAQKRLAIFEQLKQGLPPGEGDYDEDLLREGKVKGDPQMGATQFRPDALIFEFIYPDPATSATILSVRLPAPERIVFMPVPGWVVENIWQGDVDGTYQFESDAQRLVAEFSEQLSEEANAEWFGPRQPKRRE
jgi:hypothetical protein